MVQWSGCGRSDNRRPPVFDSTSSATTLQSTICSAISVGRNAVSGCEIASKGKTTTRFKSWFISSGLVYRAELFYSEIEFLPWPEFIVDWK